MDPSMPFECFTLFRKSNQSKRLEGKVAVITGGASGIGAATAKLFVEHGAKVIVADVQDDLGQFLCKGLGTDDTIFYVHCDVTCDSDMENVVDMAVSKYGKLDIMYNNAGILGDLNPTILASNNETFKKVFQVNVYGGFLGAKHAARVMIPAKKGVILFTASTASVIAGEAPHAYTVSKHAVVGLMKNLCVELGRHGIRVNCISPGAVLTPFVNNSLGIDNRVTENVLGVVLSKGLALIQPKVIAEAAVYLSSDESKSVSGLNLVVDEGHSTSCATKMSFASALNLLAMNRNTDYMARACTGLFYKNTVAIYILLCLILWFPLRLGIIRYLNFL